MPATLTPPIIERPSVVEQIIGEIEESRGDLFRATRPLTSDYPTAVEYEIALRAISDAVQRIDYVTDLIKAERRRA